MKNLIIVFIGVITIYGGLNISAYAQSEKSKENILKKTLAKEVKEIPPEVQLFGANSLNKLEDFRRECSQWPLPKRLATRLSPKKEGEALIRTINSTVKWIKTILQMKWIPEDLERRLIPLPAEIRGYDVIRVRYQIGDYYIQITSTSSALFIIIRPSTNTTQIAISDKDKKELVESYITIFLNEAERIKKNSMIVNKRPYGLSGYSEFSKETSNIWWGLVSWWTDGEAVGFTIGKAYGGKMSPTLHKDWFSEERLLKQRRGWKK